MSQPANSPIFDACGGKNPILSLFSSMAMSRSSITGLKAKAPSHSSLSEGLSECLRKNQLGNVWFLSPLPRISVQVIVCLSSILLLGFDCAVMAVHILGEVDDEIESFCGMGQVVEADTADGLIGMRLSGRWGAVEIRRLCGKCCNGKEDYVELITQVGSLKQK